MRIRRELRVRRAELGLTIYDVFKKSGVWPSTVSMIERGQSTPHRQEVIKSLASAYQMGLDEFLRVLGNSHVEVSNG